MVLSTEGRFGSRLCCIVSRTNQQQLFKHQTELCFWSVYNEYEESKWAFCGMSCSAFGADLGRVALSGYGGKLHLICWLGLCWLTVAPPIQSTWLSLTLCQALPRSHLPLCYPQFCLPVLGKEELKPACTLNKGSHDSSPLWVAINVFSCSVACQTH